METLKEQSSLQLEGYNGLDIGLDRNDFFFFIPQLECDNTSHYLVYQMEGSNGLDIGSDHNSIPQSECDITFHYLVYQYLDSEFESNMGSNCHENIQRPQPKKK